MNEIMQPSIIALLENIKKLEQELTATIVAQKQEAWKRILQESSKR